MKVFPLSAIARVIAVVTLTALFGLTANTLLYEDASRFSVREEGARRAAEHIVVVARLMEGQAREGRPQIAEFTSTEHFKLRWLLQPLAPTGNRSVAINEMHEEMVAWEPSLQGRDLRLHLGSAKDVTAVVGSLQLSDGSWLHFTAHDLLGAWPITLRQIVIASVPMLALVIVAMIALNKILRPLRLLADAVTRVGHGNSTILPEQGPGEFRRLIRAYNEMQARIMAMMKDRTLALAAVGHDLRTPLARLRLHVDSVSHADTRNALVRDLDEMELMLDSLLTFFRGDDHPEKPRLVDVAVLVSTVVDDLQDRGYNISYFGPEHCDARLRPVEFKRALSNLTNNACQYATRAVARLSVSDRTVRIRIEDNGPGIPEEDMRRVLEPFERLDPARQRNTSGVGLGIPIALRVTKDAGGRFTLSNLPEGGLCAQIELPLPASSLAILCHERAAD